jgi:hypothetical protein
MGKTSDLSDTARYRAMTADERLACFVDVCQLAQTILDARPDRAAVLARVEPMSPEAERLWLRLVKEARRARHVR